MNMRIYHTACSMFRNGAKNTTNNLNVQNMFRTMYETCLKFQHLKMDEVESATCFEELSSIFRIISDLIIWFGRIAYVHYILSFLFAIVLIGGVYSVALARNIYSNIYCVPLALPDIEYAELHVWRH